MKSISKIRLSLAWLVVGVVAVLGTVAADDNDGEITIASEHADEMIKDGVYHQWGNVVVDAPGFLHLTCDDLVATMGTGVSTNTAASTATGSTNSPAQLNQLIANGNVEIQLFRAPAKPGGLTNITYAYGTNATYVRTNGMVTLTGKPRIKTPEATATADDALYYDLTAGRFTNRGNYRVTLKVDMLKLSGAMRRNATNSAATKSTNDPAKH